MSKLKNLVCALGFVAGAGLVGDAFIQKDGKMDKREAIEYSAGFLLAAGSMYAYSKSGKKYN